MKAGDGNASPVRAQYLRIKRQYPDTLVLFRLGDFYEAFDADAELAARELDIVLTARPVSKGVAVPMAGIPHYPSYWKHLFEKSMDGFCGFLALVSMIGGVILVALDFQDSWGGLVLLPVFGFMLFLLIGN